MPIELAQWLLLAFSAYALVGVVFAIAFVSFGLRAIDPGAQHPSLALRLLLLPGSAAFWPILLRRWIGGQYPPTEINAHRMAARDRSTESLS